MFGKLTDRFQQANPGVRVTVEPNFSWDLTAYLAAVAAGDAPDVVWGATGFTHMLYTRGGLQALDQYLVKDRQWKREDYFDSALGLYTWRAKLIAMPILISGLVLYYNKSLFDRSNRRPPDADWTWDTFLDAARGVTRPSSDPADLGEYGFEPFDHHNWFGSWVWNAGGDFWNADGTKCTLDTPEAIEGLQFATDLIHRWKVAPTMQERDSRRLGWNAFNTGKVGMVVHGPTQLPAYRQAADLWELDVAPVPKGKKGRWTNVISGSVALSKTSRAPEAGWAFIRHLASEETERRYAASMVSIGGTGGGIGHLPAHKAARQAHPGGAAAAQGQEGLLRRAHLGQGRLAHAVRPGRRARPDDRVEAPVVRRPAGTGGHAGGGPGRQRAHAGGDRRRCHEVGERGGGPSGSGEPGTGGGDTEAQVGEMSTRRNGPRPAVIGTCCLSRRGADDPDLLLANGLAAVDEMARQARAAAGTWIWSCCLSSSPTRRMAPGWRRRRRWAGRIVTALAAKARAHRTFAAVPLRLREGAGIQRRRPARPRGAGHRSLRRRGGAAGSGEARRAWRRGEHGRGCSPGPRERPGAPSTPWSPGPRRPSRATRPSATSRRSPRASTSTPWCTAARWTARTAGRRWAAA